MAMTARLTVVALFLLSWPAFAKVTCTNTWYTGTVVAVAPFLLPGGQSAIEITVNAQAGTQTDCDASPKHCKTFLCAAGGDVGKGCLEVEIPSCVDYLVSQCTGGAAVVRIIEPSGACP